MKEWISMFNNSRYEVNPYTGLIRSKRRGIVKGIGVYENGKLTRLKYNIVTDDGTKTKKGHRIIAEAVLQKDLTGVPVGHKNNINGDNRFSNLVIGSRKDNSRKIQVLEWKDGVPQKRYNSISEFEKTTGIERHTFNSNELEIGSYKWEKIR